MCSNSKHSILREIYGKEKIANKVTSTQELQEEMHFSCSYSHKDVSRLWPGVTRLCQHCDVVVKSFNSQQDSLALEILGLYNIMTRAMPLRSSNTETGVTHVKAEVLPQYCFNTNILNDTGTLNLLLTLQLYVPELYSPVFSVLSSRKTVFLRRQRF